jgi:hypothetical protein
MLILYVLFSCRFHLFTVSFRKKKSDTFIKSDILGLMSHLCLLTILMLEYRWYTRWFL